MTSAAQSLHVPAQPPQRTRGAVQVLVGRGETPEVYERFARRLAGDGYDVQVSHAPKSQEAATGTDVPSYIIGIDTGAIRAARFAQRSPHAASGIILIGLPGEDDPDLSDYGLENEIEARASCPTHQSKLGEGNILTAGLLTPPAASEPTVIVGIPTLALHGADDVVSPLPAAVPRYAALGIRDLTVVESGRHDVLNSVHHRIVAATVVTFLETLRLQGQTPLIHRTLLQSGAIK